MANVGLSSFEGDQKPYSSGLNSCKTAPPWVLFGRKNTQKVRDCSMKPSSHPRPLVTQPRATSKFCCLRKNISEQTH